MTENNIEALAALESAEVLYSQGCAHCNDNPEEIEEAYRKVRSTLKRNEALEIQLQFSRDGFDGLIKALREKEGKILELVKSRNDVPQGFVLVPERLSDDFIFAAARCIGDGSIGQDDIDASREWHDAVTRTARIMLSAAPKPTGE